MALQTNPLGVQSISFQTVQMPETNFPDGSAYYRNSGYNYGFESTNWIKFWNGLDFAGFWGYTDAETGHLRGLGVIERDSVCA